MKFLDVSKKLKHDAFQELLHRFVPGLSSSALSLLEEIHELRFYEPGDRLVEEGESAHGALILRSGAAEVSVRSKSGSSITLRKISAPAILGISETMLGESNKTTWICQLPIESVFFPSSSFMAALRRFPAACLDFSRLISDELTATYSTLADIRRPAVPDRESVILSS